MKLVVQSGEAVTVVVPSDTNTSARVAVETDRGDPVATVIVESGLIGSVEEHVVRRVPTAPVEDRLALWAHLVSEHAMCIDLDLPIEQLVKMHAHEHTGPGTIRNHDPDSRRAHLTRVIAVLSESDAFGIPNMSGPQLRTHAKHVRDEVARRVSGDPEDETDARTAAAYLSMTADVLGRIAELASVATAKLEKAEVKLRTTANEE